MRKILRSVVCISLALLLTACTAGVSHQKSEPPDKVQQSATTVPKGDQDLPKAPLSQPASQQMIGADSVYNRSVEKPMVDKNTVLPENMPVFCNAYPYGHGGPMFEITQSDRLKMEDQLSEFMVMLRGQTFDLEVIEPDPEFTQDNVIYEEENFSIYSFLDGFSVMLPWEQIPEQVTAETIQATPLLQTAVDYLGIESPEISRVDQYQQDGAVGSYEIVIANHGENLMQTVLNRTSCYIKITHSTGSENTLVFIHHKDLSEEYQSFPTVSLEDAVTAARAIHSELPADGMVTADIFYTTTINPEYYIPCYQLYFTDASTGVSQSVGLTMIDLAEFEASLES